jgi:hypothetical protein
MSTPHTRAARERLVTDLMVAVTILAVGGAVVAALWAWMVVRG